ncbi:unnamed protein product, partial [Durusdinium trenchii]
MTQAGLWGVASCHHLQVGHTHEDVDAIFSLAAVALRTCQPQYLQTPMDIARRLESKLGHLWTKKGLIFNIELVDTVRDWVSLLPSGLSLKNAFRARKWIDNEDQIPLPQSFTFMTRAGLPDQGANLELSDRVPRAMRADNVIDDTFCMIKERMASDGLCQSPLLVLPGSFIEESKRLLRRANEESCPVKTCHLDQDRRDELRMLKIGQFVATEPIEKLRAYFDSKQGPSPVELVAELQQAVELQKRQITTRSMSLRDHLNRVTADYNRMVTSKKHRLDSGKKSTGVPHEVLQLDYFVPGSSSRLEHERYRGKKQFAAMLNVTDDITMTYFRRVVQDFCRKASREASTKAKAHGKSLEDFVEKHQDQSKNALRKSMEAAFA